MESLAGTAPKDAITRIPLLDQMAIALTKTDRAVAIKVGTQKATQIVELLIGTYLSADMINGLNIVGVSAREIRANNFSLSMSDNIGNVNGNIFVDGNFPIISGIKENVGLEAQFQNDGPYKINVVPGSLKIQAGMRILFALGVLNIEQFISQKLKDQNTELPKILNHRPEFREKSITLKLARLNFEQDKLLFSLI